MSDPTCSSPLSMRLAPNHSTATLDRLISRLTVGNIIVISRPPRSAVAVRSALASSKRAVSSGSRTNARTTRMPVICSRRTRLMPSMQSCIRLNAGTMRTTIEPSTIAATGIATTRIADSATSWRTARITPTTSVIGAAIAIVAAITTSICTCCTSLVMRVISDGAPNAPDLARRVPGDLVEQRGAQVATEAHRDAGAVVHGGDLERALDEREAEHQQRRGTGCRRCRRPARRCR